MNKLRLLVLILFTASAAFAQNEEEVPAETPVEGEESTEELVEDTTPVVVAKPFERIVLPLDSITNLVSYTEIVEQEESSSDSLYVRAKRFAMDRFGKSKEIFEVDKPGNKITVLAAIDGYTVLNKYTKNYAGRILFTMTVWIKEGRYKYTLTNFAHEAKGSPDPKKPLPVTYFEFYQTTNVNVKTVDNLLRTTDANIHKLIKSFKAAMKDPIQVDEEDW